MSTLSKLGIFSIFLILTIFAFLAWRLTRNEWWGGIFGNMAVGLVTLVFVDLLIDKALENQRAPAVAVSIEASGRVYGEGQRLVFDLYGAAVLSGRVSEAEHKALAAAGTLSGMAPILARTELRATAFNEPERPAIVYMYQDALAIQQSVNLALATHGQYLDPALVSALYRLGQSQLVTFIISCVQIGAVPAKFEASMFDEYFERMEDLRKAMEKADPKLRGVRAKADAYTLFSQPGLFARHSTER